MVTTRSPFSLAASEAEIPAGPAPMITTSYGKAAPFELRDGFDRLATLLDRLANEPHAAKFPRDEEARHVGFEIRLDEGNVHSALGGAEYEPYRVVWARRHARAVANACTRVHQLRLAADDAYCILGAGGDAGHRVEAAKRVDDGVQRRGFVESGFDRLGEACGPLPLVSAPSRDVPHKRREKG